MSWRAGCSPSYLCRVLSPGQGRGGYLSGSQSGVGSQGLVPSLKLPHKSCWERPVRLAPSSQRLGLESLLCLPPVSRLLPLFGSPGASCRAGSLGIDSPGYPRTKEPCTPAHQFPFCSPKSLFNRTSCPIPLCPTLPRGVLARRDSPMPLPCSRGNFPFAGACVSIS